MTQITRNTRSVSSQFPSWRLPKRKVRNILEYSILANDLFKEGKLQEAIDKFTDCLAIDAMNKGYNKNILFNRAIAWTKTGKNMQALKDLNDAIHIDGHN